MGKRIVVELTNRCNLACDHCFTGRHGGNDDISMDVIDNVLSDAKDHDFDHLSFTGGDPTVHPQFPEIIRRVAESGYKFSFVTNGWNFTTVWPRIRQYREALSVITFSVDGGNEASHDRLRGKGSFRRVMKAISMAHFEEVPFSFNMVLTAHNKSEVGDLVELATDLGARGARFGHLMPSMITTIQGADLTPAERKEVEAEIHQMRRSARIPVGMAPGTHTTDLAPCAPLNNQEINIDCHGYMSKCCHLSSHGDGAGQDEVSENLAETGFGEAIESLDKIRQDFMRFKTMHLKSGNFKDTDYFPCWYCSLYYKKVPWLAKFKKHAWVDAMWDRENVIGESKQPANN